MQHDLGTEQGIIDRCQLFRAALGEHRNTVTDDQLRAHWPGGAENENTDLGAWIYCYGSYRAFLDRVERHNADGLVGNAAAEHAAQAAARGTPEAVDLDTVDEAGVPVRRMVYPQSFHAICCIEEWDAILARLSKVYRDLETASGALLAEYGEAVLQRISYYHRLICWVLTHETTPGQPLPFVDGASATPPEWTKTLSPLDVVKFLNAHRTVNGGRLGLAMQILDPGTGSNGSRPMSWVSLMGLAAKEMGTDLRSVSRDYTLETVVYQLALSRQAERQAAGIGESEA